MLPYLLSGVTHSVTDAFFETMSGFTTTGATVFARVEAIPPGLMFWRCMTQWLGGMGVVVLSVALLPMLGVGGYRLLKAESPGGVAFERERPRITETAMSLWRIYLGMTGVLALLLVAAGMTAFDAICHAFTTMSTGGFSSHTESVAYFRSPFIHWTLILFMLIAGANFGLYGALLRGRWKTLWENSELRTYLGMIAVFSCVTALVNAQGAPSERHLRDATFHAVSIATTTGFTSSDYDQWAHLPRLLLFLSMFIGGCMGSTAGGMKVARIIIYTKAVVRELHRMIFPHGVRPLRMGKRVLDDTIVWNIFAFGTVWFLFFVIGSLVMASCGYDIVTSTTAAAAALGNVGPGLATVGPTANWGHLPDVAKWTMSFLMLCGRLELFSVLVLFTTWVWRR